LISLQYLIDGLGEDAAGNRKQRDREKRCGYAPTAAYAPIHERSFKVVFNYWFTGERRMHRYRVNAPLKKTSHCQLCQVRARLSPPTSHGIELVMEPELLSTYVVWLFRL
jgi:hypothetical protein